MIHLLTDLGPLFVDLVSHILDIYLIVAQVIFKILQVDWIIKGWVRSLNTDFWGLLSTCDFKRDVLLFVIIIILIIDFCSFIKFGLQILCGLLQTLI